MHIDRRPNEKALPGERLQTDSIIRAQIARFATDENPRSNLNHHANPYARGRLLRPGAGPFQTRGLGLVKQIEGRDDAIGNRLPVGGGNKVNAILVGGLTGHVIGPPPTRLGAHRKTERRGRAIEKLVADVGGQTSKCAILLIGQSANAGNAVTEDLAGNFGSKI